MKIVLPDGYELPENARPGEPFEAVATIKPNEDGSYELVAIDGIPIGGEAETFAANVPLPWDSTEAPA